MRSIRLSARGVAVAIVGVALALVLALPLARYAPATPPLLFFLAVVVSAWYGGLGSGLLATLLAALAIDFFFEVPAYAFSITSVDTAVELAVFLAVALLMGSLSARLRQAYFLMGQGFQQAEIARTRAEGVGSELRQTRDQLDTILQHVPDGITVHAPSGHLLYANTAVARLLGYDTSSELLAVPFGELAHRLDVRDEEGRPVSPDLFSVRQDQTGWSERETILQLRVVPTGQEYWSLFRPTSVLDDDGAVRYLVNVFVDITERKRAEAFDQYLASASKELAGSLDYQTTLQHVAQLAVPTLADWCAVDILQEDGEIRSLAVAHVDPEKVVQARESRVRYPTHRDDPTGAAQVLRTGQARLYTNISDDMLVASARSPEHLRMLRDIGFSSVMLVPLRAAGHTFGVLAFVTTGPRRPYDASDLAHAEDLAERCGLAIDNARLYSESQEQAHVQTRLNAELREAARTRDQALAEAHAAIRMRDDFLASMSHDLKNPLAAMKGLTQLQRRRLQRGGEIDRDRLDATLVGIETTVNQMAAQVDELLDVAHLQMGQSLSLLRESTDLVALANEIASEQQLTTERHAIIVDTACDALVGEWDRARLRRVIGNLLHNAIKYSTNGGEIHVSLTVDPDVADAEGHGGWAVVTVRDQGIGIPAKDLPHVFEHGHRSQNVVSKISGSGIGLTSARYIVEQHEGAIAVESEEGIGTTFIVRLPCRPPVHANSSLDEKMAGEENQG